MVCLRGFAHLRLEARMQRRQERMIGGQRQDPLLRHRALDIVVLNDCVFFQHLHRIHLVRSLPFSQHHFAERSLAQHFDEMEVGQRMLAFATLEQMTELRRWRRHSGARRRRSARLCVRIAQAIQIRIGSFGNRRSATVRIRVTDADRAAERTRSARAAHAAAANADAIGAAAGHVFRAIARRHLFVRRNAHFAQQQCHFLRIDAAIVGHIFLTAFVHVHAAHLALQALLEQSVQQRAAMIAKREPFVGVHNETMRHVNAESLATGLRRFTNGDGILSEAEVRTNVIEQLVSVSDGYIRINWPRLSCQDISWPRTDGSACGRRTYKLQRWIQNDGDMWNDALECDSILNSYEQINRHT